MNQCASATRQPGPWPTRYLMVILAALLFYAPATASAAAPVPTARIVVERERRFLQMALDGFQASRTAEDQDIAELERERDAITPLEPTQRAEDIGDLLEWHYRYADRLAAEEESLRTELAALSAPGAAPEAEVGNFEEVVNAEQELARELAEKVKAYDAQSNRLAGIIDRRRLLQSEFDELRGKLERLVQGESDDARQGARRQERRLREKIRVVQTELLSLPDVDEGILKHYTVLMEQGRWKREWVVLEAEEYAALRPVARLIGSTDPRDARALVQATDRLIRTCEGQIARLARMRDELDRKRARVSPAGTLREVERSKDLLDLYDRLQQRFDSRIRELKVKAGAWEAELAGMR